MSALGRRPDRPLLESPRRPPGPRASGITLWRPEIVLPRPLQGVDHRRVVPGEPSLRPDAVRARIEAARSALDALRTTHQALAGRTVDPADRRDASGTERQRVAAVMESYRVQAALDAALRGTLGRLTATDVERNRK